MDEIGSGSFGKVYKADNKNVIKMCTLHTINTISNSVLKEAVFYSTLDTSNPLFSGAPKSIPRAKVIHKQHKLGLLLEHHGTVLSKMEFSKPLALQVCSQVLAACSWLHARQWSHGDIKPDNILVKNNAVTLIDFGSVLFSPRFALEGQRCTLLYVSPEELLHHRSGPSTDIWSLGATLFEFITGSFFMVKLMKFLNWEEGMTKSAIKSFYSQLLYGTILQFLYKTIKDRELLRVLAHCFIIDVKDRATADKLLTTYEVFKDYKHLVADNPVGVLKTFSLAVDSEKVGNFTYNRPLVLTKIAEVLTTNIPVCEQKELFAHSLALFDSYLTIVPLISLDDIQDVVMHSCMVSSLMFKGTTKQSFQTEPLYSFCKTLQFQFFTLYPAFICGIYEQWGEPHELLVFEQYLKLVSVESSLVVTSRLISSSVARIEKVY
jgi:serine/threonine protein kinase